MWGFFFAGVMQDWTVAGWNLLGNWSEVQNVKISAQCWLCLCKMFTSTLPVRPFGRWLGILYSVQPFTDSPEGLAKLQNASASHHSLMTSHSAGQARQGCSSFVFSFGEILVPISKGLWNGDYCCPECLAASLFKPLYQIRMHFILNEALLLEEVLVNFLNEGHLEKSLHTSNVIWKDILNQKKTEI